MRSPDSYRLRLTRRDLLKTGAGAAALAALPRTRFVTLGHAPEPVPPIDDPRVKALAMRALESAKSAGAVYADVRLTYNHYVRLKYDLGLASPDESLTVGVRALVDGYWGFAASPTWSVEEMARLGREAVHQAKANTLGKPRVVEFAPAPVATGHWATPMKRDPFSVPVSEVRDFLGGLEFYAQRKRNRRADAQAEFRLVEKAFGSTEGSYCTQQLYNTGSHLVVTADIP